MPKHEVDGEHRLFARRLRRDMPKAEEMLWGALRGGRLDGWKFKRQVPFGRYVADFSCAKAALIVELDGPHHARPDQVEHDRARDAWLRSRGLRVLRIANEDVLASLELVVRRIVQALTAPSPGLLRRPPSPSRGEG